MIFSKIKFENRLKNSKFNNIFITADGTNFHMNEPSPFSSQLYSNKFNALGLVYEVAVPSGAGNMVLANGWFCCGSYPDIKVFNEDLKNAKIG